MKRKIKQSLPDLIMLATVIYLTNLDLKAGVAMAVAMFLTTIFGTKNSYIKKEINKMNKNIEALLQGLQDECNKAELPMVCGIIDKNNDAQATLVGGALIDQSIILSILTELFLNSVKNGTCNCSNCEDLREAFGFKQKTSESDSNIDDLLQTFLRGELN